MSLASDLIDDLQDLGDRLHLRLFLSSRHHVTPTILMRDNTLRYNETAFHKFSIINPLASISHHQQNKILSLNVRSQTKWSHPKKSERPIK